MQTKGLLIGLFIFLSYPSFIYAEPCDLNDPDFPHNLVNDPDEEPGCSFNDLSVNVNALRFGRFDEVVETGVIRSGVNLYTLEEGLLDSGNAYDVQSSDCALNSSLEDNINRDIAFILDGDSLRAPRVITQLWLLDCEITKIK